MANQHRLNNRLAGALAGLAAAATLSMGVGPSIAEVRLPPLDAGASAACRAELLSNHELAAPWEHVPTHYTHQPAHTFPTHVHANASMQTPTTASAHLSATPLVRPTQCPTSSWICDTAISATRTCRASRSVVPSWWRCVASKKRG